MKKSVLNTSIVLVMAAAGLAGCSRGPLYESSATAAATASSGKAADGYISGAIVTLDMNDDRICSPGEPTTTTDANGDFAFDANIYPGKHMACSSGGIDLASGAPFTGQLLAAPGATVISPLSSLVMSQINDANPPVLGVTSVLSDSAISSANSAVATSLGLTGLDLANADPVATAATNPGLLQTTQAIQALMAQTAAIVAAAGGGNGSEALTKALYANAMKSVLTALAANPITPGTNVSDLASSVISKTADLAATDPLVLGSAPNMADVNPANLAALAGPALAAMANAIATADVADLSTPGTNNPMASAINNESLSNTVDALSDLLTDAAAAGGLSPAELATIGDAALNVNPDGSISAAPVADTLAAIAAADPTITLDTSALDSLATANQLSDVVRVTSVNVGGTMATLADNQPYQAIANNIGNLRNMTIGFGAPSGNPIQGGVSATPLASEAVASTAQTGRLSVVMVPVTANADKRVLTFDLDGVTLFETSNGSMGVEVPASAKLMASETNTRGITAEATISGSTVKSANVVSYSSANKSVTLDLAALQTALAGNNTSFGVLSSMLNGNNGVGGQTFRITAAFSNLNLSIGPVATPLKSRVYTVDVKFAQ